MKPTRAPFLCLVCGVDSGPVRTFLLVFIGCLVAASLFTLAWAKVTRRLDGGESLANASLEAERKEPSHE